MIPVHKPSKSIRAKTSSRLTRKTSSQSSTTENHMSYEKGVRLDNVFIISSAENKHSSAQQSSSLSMTDAFVRRAQYSSATSTAPMPPPLQVCTMSPPTEHTWTALLGVFLVRGRIVWVVLLGIFWLCQPWDLFAGRITPKSLANQSFMCTIVRKWPA